MEFLEDASEVELIVCIALTELKRDANGNLELPEGKEHAVARHVGSMDQEEHPIILSRSGLDEWITDTKASPALKSFGLLMHRVVQVLGSHQNTLLPEFIQSDRSPSNGLLLSIEVVLHAFEVLEDFARYEGLEIEVLDRLCTGFWSNPNAPEHDGGGSPGRVVEPNLALRIAPARNPKRSRKKVSTVKREVLTEMARLALTSLYQDTVAARVRTRDGTWKMVFFDERHFRESTPVPLPAYPENSVALLSGCRSVSENILSKLRTVSGNHGLRSMAFTLELRPSAESAPTPEHLVLVRQACTGGDGPTLDQLFFSFYGQQAEFNRLVSEKGIEKKFFIPVVHHCTSDLKAHQDLSCGSPGAPYTRWCTRCRLASHGTESHPRILDYPECSCTHLRVEVTGKARRSDYTACLGSFDEPRCSVEGPHDRVFYPVRPPIRAELGDWLKRNWRLDWLDQLAPPSKKPADVPEQAPRPGKDPVLPEPGGGGEDLRP